jgi:soluble lytic murein transglycosylase-like protein
MNDSGFSRLRAFALTPLTLVLLFFIYNFAAFFLSSTFSPSVKAVTARGTNYIPSDIPTSGDAHLDQLIFRAGEKYGVDPRLLHAVIWQESKYEVRARSNAGAQGLMQLIPATASRFDCRNANDPAQNIEAGTKYLRWLLERFDGNLVFALAGFNAGEGAVDKYDGVPPYNETQNYVRIITLRYGKTFHPLFSPEDARVQFGLIPDVAQLVN